MVDTLIGMREIYGEPRLFGIGEDDKRQHLYCIGKSGTGKSTLLRNLIVQEIEAGRGVGLIDPHGDLCEELLEVVPRRRTDDLVYLDAGDLEHPVGLNLLEQVAIDERHLVVANVVSTFRHLWADSWGPRSEYILANAVAALLEFPAEKGGATLLGLPRILVDEASEDGSSPTLPIRGRARSGSLSLRLGRSGCGPRLRRLWRTKPGGSSPRRSCATSSARFGALSGRPRSWMRAGSSFATWRRAG